MACIRPLLDELAAQLGLVSASTRCDETLAMAEAELQARAQHQANLLSKIGELVKGRDQATFGLLDISCLVSFLAS